MSSVLFPVFPGLGYSVVKRPSALTATSLSASGKRVSIARYSLGNPIWEFTLTFNFLNRRQKYGAIGQVPVPAALSDVANLIADDVAALEGFFLARQGRYDTWLFEDPRDCAIALQQIGTGNGSSTAFQIVRQLGEYQEDIKQINGTAVSAPNWAPTTAQILNNLIVPTPAAIRTQQDPIISGYQSSGWPVYYKCTSPGTTGLREPRWRQLAPLAGMTLMDGNVTWTCQGAPLLVYVGTTPTPTVQAPSAYSLGSGGIINLNAAPAIGQNVFVTTSFCFRCEFKEDMSQFETFMNQFVANRQLSFRSVKT
jgi:hypothetical protein